jgi:hypothetical protein
MSRAGEDWRNTRRSDHRDLAFLLREGLVEFIAMTRRLLAESTATNVPSAGPSPGITPRIREQASSLELPSQ